MTNCSGGIFGNEEKYKGGWKSQDCIEHGYVSTARKKKFNERMDNMVLDVATRLAPIIGVLSAVYSDVL